MKKVFCCVVVCVLSSFSVQANDITVISSGITRYKKDNITCIGNVVAVYCDRVIAADKISYDRQNRTITASGGVIIKDKSQNVCFADEISVNQNFQSGVAKNIKIIMNDKSRIAAKDCSIKKGKYFLNNAVYSPCHECNSSGEITWQIKSQHVVYDPNGSIDYDNVQFEVLGVPLIYTPYFSHEKSTSRKSGILPPKIATSSSNGLTLMVPYLWAISNSQEIIFKPMITTKAGGIAWAEYNWRFPHGKFNLDVSATNLSSLDCTEKYRDIPKEKIDKIRQNGYRGHLFATLDYEINNTWRTGIDIKLVSDQFYLKRFSFLPYQERTLESNARLEGFDGDNYTLLKCAKFQTENYDSIPRIFPMIERNYYKELFGGTISVDVMGMNLDFNNSRSAQKIIANASWSKSIFLMFGQLLQVSGMMSTRALRVDEKNHSQYNSTCTITPQISCIWSWPLAATKGKYQTIITPIIGMVWAGNSKFQDIFEFPFSELNALNLFTGNRSISAYDVDAGHRICYGARFSGYYEGQNIYQVIVGRSSELGDVQQQAETSGLKYKNSDILFGADVFFSPKIIWVSRGSYCHHTKHWTRIETGLEYQYKKYDFNVMIFNGRHCFYNPFNDQIYGRPDAQKIKRYKGVSFDMGYQTTPKVKLTAGFIIGNRAHNDPDEMQKDSEQCKLIKKKIGIIYKNECSEFRGEMAVNRFRSGDVKPETVFKFSIHLKNLGI